MRLPLAFVIGLAACPGPDPAAGDDRNPPRLYLALLGSEVGGQVQLVPVEPVPF